MDKMFFIVEAISIGRPYDAVLRNLLLFILCINEKVKRTLSSTVKLVTYADDIIMHIPLIDEVSF